MMRRIVIALSTSLFVIFMCLEYWYGPFFMSHQVNQRLKLGKFHRSDMDYEDDGDGHYYNDQKIGFGLPEERGVGFGLKTNEKSIPEQRQELESEHSFFDGNVDQSTDDTGRYGKPIYGSVMNQIIIYNAVPKSGSRTLISVLMEKLYIQRIPMGSYRMFPDGKTRYAGRLIPGDGTLPHSFNGKGLIREDGSLDQSLNGRMSDLTGAANTIPEVLRKEKPPLFVHGHFLLPNVSDDMKPAPIYINMIRDPLERFRSSFYWLAYGDMLRGKDRSGTTQSFDTCILRGLESCMSPHLFAHQRLCGEDIRCRFDSRWAVQRAKENVDSLYTFIGISEEFETSLRIFERLLPDVFGGVADHYTSGIGLNYTTLTATVSKEDLSPDMEEMARLQLQEEYELYNYIYVKFQRMKMRYGLQ